ncbi:MAG: M24 family metallopeptidase [Erythrobacter sp.]
MRDKRGNGIDRRHALTGGAGIVAAAALAGSDPISASNHRGHDRTGGEVCPPDLDFLRRESLVNEDRLRFFMREAGLDALVVTQPANVFYLTNHWPQLDRMGFDGSGIAIFCADPARPLAVVMHAFLYYYTHTPESEFTDREIFTYTNPVGAPEKEGGEPPSAPARVMEVADGGTLTSLDRHRLNMFGRTKAPSADATWALKKALQSLGLWRGRVGTDHAGLDAALEARGFEGEVARGGDVVRTARLVKSPTELKLMRMASEANVAAAMAAASRARELGGARALRSAFFGEAGLRGNSGHFMVIAGTSTEALDREFEDGMSVSIDCVSTCRFYHGDFGRTIFVGEPPRAVQQAANAVSTAWEEIREQLRPGMRFSEIPRIGRATLARLGADLNVSFRPHSVGLFHTDQPATSLLVPTASPDLTLEEDMILSVDCPVFLAGLGGTIHLEDLMLIKDGRAEAIHNVPLPVITV